MSDSFLLWIAVGVLVYAVVFFVMLAGLVLLAERRK